MAIRCINYLHTGEVETFSNPQIQIEYDGVPEQDVGSILQLLLDALKEDDPDAQISPRAYEIPQAGDELYINIVYSEAERGRIVIENVKEPSGDVAGLARICMYPVKDDGKRILFLRNFAESMKKQNIEIYLTGPFQVKRTLR
ncbi:Uncharacterised protein [uncultured archaeon]|nr:Uncharacterised protein [uncultured archaeon]